MTPIKFMQLLEKDGVHKYACLMLEVTNHDLLAEVAEMRSHIKPDDLAGEGMEDGLHITVLYGLHEADEAAIMKVIQSLNMTSVAFRFTGVSSFPPSPHSDGASVLKLDVESDDLHRLNAALREQLKCTVSFPEYRAHATLAYVSDKVTDTYCNIDVPRALLDPVFAASRLVLSAQDGTKTRIEMS